MFIVKCPTCKHNMRYQAIKTGLVTQKKKKCVYCGHTFKIHSSKPKTRIVKEERKNSTTPLVHNELQAAYFKEKLN